MLLSPPMVALGINCRGSLYCIGMDKSNVTGRMYDLTTTIPSRAIYALGAHIACEGTKELLTGHVGAFCLFMQGPNAHSITNPITGDRFISIDGAFIKQKTLQLYQHGCRACGSVPLSDDNDPGEQGILTLNYVNDNAGCNGSRACDPTIAAGDHVHNPLETGQDVVYSLPNNNTVVSTVNATDACTVPSSSPRQSDSVAAVAQLEPTPPQTLGYDCDSFGYPSPRSSSVAVEDAAIAKAIASVRSKGDLGISKFAVAANVTASNAPVMQQTTMLIRTISELKETASTISAVSPSPTNSDVPSTSGRSFTGWP